MLQTTNNRTREKKKLSSSRDGRRILHQDQACKPLCEIISAAVEKIFDETSTLLFLPDFFTENIRRRIVDFCCFGPTPAWHPGIGKSASS